ncbi:MAG: D-alanyl-D-alanine carboxypeptidase/D-alanyl-D-alanine-endopeptidase, partial [Limnothrix sp.]
LKANGITHIKEVIIDDSYFTELAVNPTWEWSDLPAYYAVPVNSLILDQNVVTLTLSPTEIGQPAEVKWSDNIAASQWQLDNQLITAAAETPYQGRLSQQYGTTKLQLKGQIAMDANADIWALSIPDPVQYVVDKVELILLEDRITVGKKTVSKTSSVNLENIEPFTTILSPPLADIIRTTNQDSNNLFAESLRHTLISETVNIPETLTNLGIDSANYRLRDGSGLSRHNLATPMTFVDILDTMAEHPEADVYKKSLAIAATSGTLSRRFQDTPVAGQFFGKTGTMTNVGGLSGYLNLDGDRPVALSILVNQSEQPASVTRRGIDDVVGAIYEWGECRGDRP